MRSRCFHSSTEGGISDVSCERKSTVTEDDSILAFASLFRVPWNVQLCLYDALMTTSSYNFSLRGSQSVITENTCVGVHGRCKSACVLLQLNCKRPMKMSLFCFIPGNYDRRKEWWWETKVWETVRFPLKVKKKCQRKNYNGEKTKRSRERFALGKSKHSLKSEDKSGSLFPECQDVSSGCTISWEWAQRGEWNTTGVSSLSHPILTITVKWQPCKQTKRRSFYTVSVTCKSLKFIHAKHHLSHGTLQL